MKRMTPRRETILEYYRRKTKFGMTPTLSEMAAEMGMSLSTAHAHLKRLTELGRMKKVANRYVLACYVDPAQEVERLRHAMESALANPHVWRETLESARADLATAQRERDERPLPATWWVQRTGQAERERDEAQAENARLRAALEVIAHRDNWREGRWVGGLITPRLAAQAALREEAPDA